MAFGEKKQTAIDFWKSIAKAHDTIKKANNQVVEEFGLTAAQFGIIEVLNEHGPLPLKKISYQLYVTGANMTSVIDKLEADSLVVRVHSKEDRRVIYAELTDKGKDVLKKILPKFLDNLLTLCEKVSIDEQKQLISVVGKFLG